MTLRLCASCKQIDNHPRHTMGYGPDEVVPQLSREERKELLSAVAGDADKIAAVMDYVDDQSTVLKHLDCCLSDGCPDGTCDRRLADDNDPFDGGKTTGEKLIKKFVAALEKNGS